jgi:hypothetical protein
MEARTLQSPAATVSTRLIIGAFLTALGIVLTLDNFRVIQGDDYLVWWPMVFVAIGLVKLAGGGSRVAAVILILAGAWLTAYQHGVIRVTFFDLWPLILIGAGALMVARALGVKGVNLPEQSGDTFWGILNVRKIVETRRDYRGGRYTAFMGGFELDLTHAEIAESPAIIETYAIWSGTEIYVPYEWEVVGEVVPVMGAFEMKLRGGQQSEKRVIVRGFALMAGIEVKHAPRRTV